ncbi:MAG TPA: hypothetical protein VGL93_21870 [Streptosporangiaceae bacterium]|jgi:hypothetical protein
MTASDVRVGEVIDKARELPRSRWVRVPAVVTLLSAAALAGGTFLPWLETTAGRPELSLPGVGSGTGVIVLLLALTGTAVALGGLLTRPFITAAALAPGAAAAILVVHDLLDVVDAATSDTGPSSVDIAPGTGVLVCGVAAFSVITGALAALLIEAGRRRR